MRHRRQGFILPLAVILCFLMMLIAFAVGIWLGTHMDGTVRPLAYGVWFWSVIISGCAWTLVQRYGSSSER